jgi:thiosulfate/3-mercaptopyruvate sulfurtransferase
LSKQACEELLQKAGLNYDTTLILYGDFNNWFAAFAFWVFKYYGYNDVRLMNGGRKKWLLEDRPMSKEIPQYAKGNFKASEADNSIRVFLNYVKDSSDKVRKNTLTMVDVQNPKVQKNLQEKFYLRQNIQQNMLREEAHTPNRYRYL